MDGYSWVGKAVRRIASGTEWYMQGLPDTSGPHLRPADQRRLCAGISERSGACLSNVSGMGQTGGSAPRGERLATISLSWYRDSPS